MNTSRLSVWYFYRTIFEWNAWMLKWKQQGRTIFRYIVWCFNLLTGIGSAIYRNKSVSLVIYSFLFTTRYYQIPNLTEEISLQRRIYNPILCQRNWENKNQEFKVYISGEDAVGKTREAWHCLSHAGHQISLCPLLREGHTNNTPFSALVLSEVFQGSQWSTDKVRDTVV